MIVFYVDRVTLNELARDHLAYRHCREYAEKCALFYRQGLTLASDLRNMCGKARKQVLDSDTYLANLPGLVTIHLKWEPLPDNGKLPACVQQEHTCAL